MKNSNKIFQCDNIVPFINTIKHELKYSGFSRSSFFMCEHKGVPFLTKVAFYTKSSIKGRHVQGIVKRVSQHAPKEYRESDDSGDYSYESASLSDIMPSALSEGISDSPNAIHVIPFMHHIDTEIEILKIMKEEIIDKNVSPCILEIIFAKKCQNLRRLLPKGKTCDSVMRSSGNIKGDALLRDICVHADKQKYGLYEDKIAFIVVEKCDITLADMLANDVGSPVGYSVFKSILFQILYTLYAIRVRFPRFRHNDLHAENIMLKFDAGYKLKFAEPRYLTYIVGTNTYYLPYFGLIPKIIDFGFATIPEMGIESEVVDDPFIMYARHKHEYVSLFGWIERIVMQYNSDKHMHVRRLLASLEPNGSYLRVYKPFVKKLEPKMPSYGDLITNSVFDEYKLANEPPSSQIIGPFTPVGK